MSEIIYDENINRNPLKTVPGYVEISPDGSLLFAGKDCCQLAKEYGTPLFVFSEAKIRKNYRQVKAALDANFSRGQVCFACKSNSLLSVLNILREEGAWVDTVSEMEYLKALRVGFDPARIVLNGNNKSRSELRLAIDGGSLINCDSLSELAMIEEEAALLNKRARLSFRVNCDVDSGVIPEFSTALKSSKFGMDLDGDAFMGYKRAAESEWCQILGIHSHIGSQIENRQCYEYAAKCIMNFCLRLKNELGIELEYVNMGGGYAIPFDYLDEYDTVESFASTIAGVFHSMASEYGLREPELLIEPGGSVIGTTAVALFIVGNIKHKETLDIAAIDAGGDALLRATQGWYSYRVVCAGKTAQDPAKLYNIAGPLCYEGDIPARNRMLPALEAGDVLAFMDAGAYTTTLFNNYNGRPSPCVLLVSGDGNIRVIKERQTFEDLIRGEKL